MKNQIQNLLSKEMSRQEFLSTVATGALILVGGQLAQNALFNNQPSKRSGYGSSPYGGGTGNVFTHVNNKS